MFTRILTLAQNAFRELYRDRFFLVLVFGVILFFLLSILLGELSFEEHMRILFDIGISAIHWMCLGLAVFLGGNSLRRELERQTYMTLLATPLSRLELLLGKFFGIFAVSTISTILLGAGLLFLLNSPGIVANFALVLLGIIAETGVLLALALLFSLLFSPFVSIFSSLGLFLIGQWLESLQILAQKSGNEGYQFFARGISWILPNLYRLNWRSVYVLDNGLAGEVVWGALAHALGWMGILLILAHVLFNKRNLT